MNSYGPAFADKRKPVEPIRSIYEDDEDMVEIIREFAAELPERVTSLENLLASGDLEELMNLAHQLKGAGGGYGLQPITDVAAVLEQAIKNGDDAGALKEKTSALCETLNAVVVSEAS